MDPCPTCEEGDPEKTYEVFYCPECNGTETHGNAYSYRHSHHCANCTDEDGDALVVMKLKRRCREHVPPHLFCSGCKKVDQVEILAPCLVCSLYYCGSYRTSFKCRSCGMVCKGCYCRLPWTSRVYICFPCIDEMASERLECEGLVKSANKVTT